MASMQIPMQGLERTDGGSRNQKDIWLAFRMPEGQTIEAADRFIAGVEDTLLSHRESYGLRLVETWSSNSFGRIHLILEEDESNDWYAVAWNDLLESAGLRHSPHMDYVEVLEDIEERLPMPPGFEMRINWRDGGGSDNEVSVNLHGPDTDRLVELSREVERRLEGIPGLLSVQTDVDRGATELRVRLDRAQVRRYGLDPRVISGNISYALRGRELTRMHTDDGREVSVFFQLREADRRSLHQLRNLSFRAPGGNEIPLETLARLEVAQGLGGIRREDRQTVLAVTATTTEAGAESLFEQVDEAMAGFETPRGYRWDKGERYQRLQQQEDSRMFALILSVTFVFLLMGVLFESFMLPLSVIVAIPFSFLGVFWTLYLTKTPFDMLSGIGTVILVGVVVNNAIVLIDLANRLRAEGHDRFEALMEAGRLRFRPILMTTFTTICGLLPMAVGNARMIGMPYAPLGRTMMGGLLASMVLTLVIVPLCYTFFDDLRELLRRVGGSAVAAARER